MNKKMGLLLASYFLLLVLYAIFSFSLTDPNLVLFRNNFYQDFQKMMWSVFFENRLNLSIVFLFLVTLLFANYFLLLKNSANIKTLNKNFKKYLVIFGIIVSPLLFSYNALSHDVFNYIFNAKIVIQYQQNPHEKVALDFAEDNWTRFMHNTHTPAPYGYGWTILSLFPYLLGFGKFFLIWMSFRFFSVLSIFALIWSLVFFAKKTNIKIKLYKFLVVFLNPLFLIEIVSNSHNDLWMLIPAIISLALIVDISQKTISRKNLTISLLLLLISISIKFATLALIPLWILAYFIKNGLLDLNKQNMLLKKILSFIFQKIQLFYNRYLPLFASILLFLPLLTLQSKYFLPWYLIWSFIWLVFIDFKKWTNLLIIFSISSLLRYLPWLWTGEFSDAVQTQQKIIQWIMPCIYLLFLYLNWHYKRLMSKGIISLKSKTIS